MSSTAFIEPLPVVEFVAQVLGKDISIRPLSDADRVKVDLLYFILVLIFNISMHFHFYIILNNEDHICHSDVAKLRIFLLSILFIWTGGLDEIIQMICLFALLRLNFS